MGIPFIYTPYVHWKTEAYQNVTPEESDRQIDSQPFHLKLHVKEGNIKKIVSRSLYLCVNKSFIIFTTYLEDTQYLCKWILLKNAFASNRSRNDPIVLRVGPNVR